MFNFMDLHLPSPEDVEGHICELPDLIWHYLMDFSNWK